MCFVPAFVTSYFQASAHEQHVYDGFNLPIPYVFYPRATLMISQGEQPGPILADALESYYGAANVWVQGVGGAYTAGLLDNLQPKGTTDAAIAEGARLFKLANTKCPNSPVVAGGYR